MYAKFGNCMFSPVTYWKSINFGNEAYSILRGSLQRFCQRHVKAGVSKISFKLLKVDQLGSGDHSVLTQRRAKAANYMLSIWIYFRPINLEVKLTAFCSEAYSIFAGGAPELETLCLGFIEIDEFGDEADSAIARSAPGLETRCFRLGVLTMHHLGSELTARWDKYYNLFLTSEAGFTTACCPLEVVEDWSNESWTYGKLKNT